MNLISIDTFLGFIRTLAECPRLSNAGQQQQKTGTTTRMSEPLYLAGPRTTQPFSSDAAVSDEDGEGEDESKNKGSVQDRDHPADSAAIMPHEI
jgi:hypothetical protein